MIIDQCSTFRFFILSGFIWILSQFCEFIISKLHFKQKYQTTWLFLDQKVFGAKVCFFKKKKIKFFPLGVIFVLVDIFGNDYIWRP